MNKSPVERKGKSRPFRLLRYFTLFSLTSIIITSAVLGTWFRSIAVGNLLISEERNNVALTHALSQSVWPHYASFLQSAASLPVDKLRQHPLTKEIDNYISEQFTGMSILKVKIYDMDGYTVFSSDVSQIGASKKNHASFIAAREGGVISKLSFRDKFYAKQELVSNLNIVASYVPIKRQFGASVEGVFELYKDVTPLIADIENTQRKVILGVSAILALLFFFLFLVIRHADRVIRQYNRQQEENAAMIEHQAFHDALTGLPNRILFLDRLEHAIEHAKRDERLIGVMFIDLDKFKEINDTFGHEKGDELIRIAAERIVSCLRSSDTAARLAGDEFMVILEGLHTIDRITEVAKRIVYTMNKPIDFDGTPVIATCSVGVSVYPFDEHDNATSLIKKADSAMYQAKGRGRNSYMFYMESMTNEKVTRQISLEHDLYRALDNDEFRVFFQPKVDIKNWKMNSMEALARWEHRSDGIILPGKFISILEETGMIARLGESILHQSCVHNRKWQDEGLPPLKVAVNVSALQFKQHDFVGVVDQVLKDTGMPAKYLEVELTESCLIDDMDTNVEILKALKARGIHIAIDDFGTGYSSLSYLCKLPVSTLKVDRAFVKNIHTSKEHRSIITAIISFAHGLKMHIVAEGVETMEELTFLSAMRCNTIQGFLFSKPLAVPEFEKLYRAGGDFSHVLEEIRENGRQQA